jgi:hypothetical protein
LQCRSEPHIQRDDWFGPATFTSFHSDELLLPSSCRWGTRLIPKTLKLNRAIMQDERGRDLCWEAMHEKDVNKLLTIFLELDLRQKASS